MKADQIIIGPVLTEKTNRFREAKKYVFHVDAHANKLMVKKAVQELFNVHCKSCTIVTVKRKPKRLRQQWGYTETWKKAIVSILPNETIAVFEGV